jgi:hypothetical protein
MRRSTNGSNPWESARAKTCEIGLALDLAFSSRNLPRVRQAADEKCGHDQVSAALRSRLHASGAAPMSRDWIVQWLAEGINESH